MVGRCHHMMFPLHAPRMCDSLAQPLRFLTGRPLQAFQDIFCQFDSTRSENTTAILSFLGNIIKAPFQLAEKCRPMIEEIIAEQGSSDPNILLVHGPIHEEPTENLNSVEFSYVNTHFCVCLLYSNNKQLAYFLICSKLLCSGAFITIYLC